MRAAGFHGAFYCSIKPNGILDLENYIHYGEFSAGFHFIFLMA